MPRRTSYLHCVISGCRTRAGSESYMRQHQEAAHKKCACGWVGVSHAGHVGQLRRLGYRDVDERHPIVNDDVMSEMAEVGPWLLPGLG